MWKKNMSQTEKTNYERLGNILTFWYPSMPKTYGLTFLREFLENYDAWGRFIRNYHDVPKKEGFNEYCRYIFNTKDYRHIISWAFNWADTKEGVEYWAKLETLFNDFLDKKEDEGVKLDKIAQKDKVKTIQAPMPKQKGNFIDPIYAFLSGATNVMQMAQGYQAMAQHMSSRKKKLGFKVPISATTIFGTSL